MSKKRKYNPELRALTITERKFVDNLITMGVSNRLDAYAIATDTEITESSKSAMQTSADTMFYRPHVLKHYEALMEEVRDEHMKKSEWTREVATEKLMNLINKAEKELDDSNITMARMQAIIQASKELNLMNGFNQTNVNMEGTTVTFVGEEDLQD